jgi:hypothetical protein
LFSLISNKVNSSPLRIFVCITNFKSNHF